MPKKETKAKTGKKSILDNVKVVKVIVAKFEIKTITLKNLTWSVEMLVNYVLPKSHHDYRITMSFDEDPFKFRIESLEKDREAIKKENTLFEDGKTGRINIKNDEIAAVMDERDQVKANCPTIEYNAVVEKVDWTKAAKTVLKIRIPDEVIPPINKSKAFFSHYKVELEPLEV